ncbi:DUF302 domain-containing protein [Roseovarius nanhaiticus]|uniref:DUF302 domain-containing protein n=1 Tax=Roseovarius nanhaiticus TaxID=573024 RepID=UPI002491F9C3|nr:DUF302 domain-containing protein [Roseovarius nanhaiticus]
MKQLITAAIFALMGSMVSANEESVTHVEAVGDVAETMSGLQKAVNEAGATVFAMVDHAEGAERAGMDLAPAQLLIFGNPKMGTQVMQDDILAGLHLPMKVLVYEDEDGQVYLAYEDPAIMLGNLSGVAPGATYIAEMRAALSKLTNKAASADH